MRVSAREAVWKRDSAAALSRSVVSGALLSRRGRLVFAAVCYCLAQLRRLLLRLRFARPSCFAEPGRESLTSARSAERTVGQRTVAPPTEVHSVHKVRLAGCETGGERARLSAPRALRD